MVADFGLFILTFALSVLICCFWFGCVCIFGYFDFWNCCFMGCGLITSILVLCVVDDCCVCCCGFCELRVLLLGYWWLLLCYLLGITFTICIVVVLFKWLLFVIFAWFMVGCSGVLFVIIVAFAFVVVFFAWILLVVCVVCWLWVLVYCYWFV